MVNIQPIIDTTPESLYDLLKQGVVFAGFTKKDGTASYRVVTANSEVLERALNNQITNEDRGLTRRSHWADDLSQSEKVAQILRGEKPLFVHDVINSRNISIILTNVLTSETLFDDIPNLKFLPLSELDSEAFKELRRGKITPKEFLDGGDSHQRIKVNQEGVKTLKDQLERGVLYASFRKKSGEVRLMIATRHPRIIDRVAGERDTHTKLDDNRGRTLTEGQILTSGVIPVFDFEKKDFRVISTDALIIVEAVHNKPVAILDVNRAIAFSEAGDFSENAIKELVATSKVKGRRNVGEDENHLSPIERAAIIMTRNLQPNTVADWNKTRQPRFHYGLKDFANKYLQDDEFRNVEYEVRPVKNELAFLVRLNTLVRENTLVRFSPKVFIISPKGIFNVTDGVFEFNAYEMTHSKRTGVNNQQTRFITEFATRRRSPVEAAFLHYLLDLWTLNKSFRTIEFKKELFFNQQG